jgi:hypothetical protein
VPLPLADRRCYRHQRAERLRERGCRHANCLAASPGAPHPTPAVTPPPPTGHEARGSVGSCSRAECSRGLQADRMTLV